MKILLNPASSKIVPWAEFKAQASEKLHDDSTCYKSDFGRESIPGVETGGRIYICKHKDAEYNVDKNGINIGGKIGFAGGINLASGLKNKLSLG